MAVTSKDMLPFPANFGKVFYHNQFQVKIPLPTRAQYGHLQGQVGIVTGANTGLGFAAAKQLLGLGLSHLVMAVRSLEKGRVAAAALRESPGGTRATIDVWALDMDSYDSIQAFVRRCDADLARIDWAILNAGLAPTTFAANRATGHENTIQVNHISTALLTVLLLPVLQAKSTRERPARLTSVNSVTAHLCKFPNRDRRPLLPSFDDTTITPYDGEERYGVSKLLAQLFLIKLAAKVNPDRVVINMVDPGLTKGTGLSRDATGLMRLGAKAFFSVAGRPVERGAATYVDAALGHGREVHGCFLMNTEIAPYATFYYTEAGKKAQEQIWAETIKELSFAHVEGIIASMK